MQLSTNHTKNTNIKTIDNLESRWNELHWTIGTDVAPAGPGSQPPWINKESNLMVS
jgi:hypothetical protein